MSTRDPSDELRKRILASVSPETRFAGFLDALVRDFGFSLSAARDILARARSAAGWQSSSVPGHHFKLLSDVDTPGQRLVLVRFAPGATFPEHLHRVDETAFCLSGRATHNRTRTVDVGDTVVTPANQAHEWHSVGDVDCLLLIGRSVVA